jgi:hypothetical protein
MSEMIMPTSSRKTSMSHLSSSMKWYGRELAEHFAYLSRSSSKLETNNRSYHQQQHENGNDSEEFHL